MNLKNLNQSPFVAFLIALIMGLLGYILLSKGNLLIGAFAFWASGVNTFRAADGWLKYSNSDNEKTLERYAEYCRKRDAQFPDMVDKWSRP